MFHIASGHIYVLKWLTGIAGSIQKNGDGVMKKKEESKGAFVH